jgi:hypothetical protein
MPTVKPEGDVVRDCKEIEYLNVDWIEEAGDTAYLLVGCLEMCNRLCVP